MTLDDWTGFVFADLLDTSVDAAKARAATMDDSLIPKGSYCYHRLAPNGTTPDGRPRMTAIVCPFWAADPSKPEQAFGYCAKLQAGDWEEDVTMLLWDMVKECGLNPDPEEDC